MYDLIIIGSGAAGLSAGVYGGRYLMKIAIIDGEFGGGTATAGSIQNYPGVMSIDGYDLMMNMRNQAKNLGCEYINENVTSIKNNNGCFEVVAGNNTYQASAVILATGARRRQLGLTNEKELTGLGIHYCITCDAPLYKNKTIAIVGGGDTSVKGANLAAEYAKKIYFIVRGKNIIAEAINYEQLKKLGEKIEIIFETEIKEIVGKEKLEKLVLSKPHNGSTDLIVDGAFVEVGILPNNEFAKSVGAELDESGYIKVDNMMRTNVAGFFAAGDVTNFFGRFKQDITAAAMGSVAATSAYEENKIHGDLCMPHAKPSDNL
jgi:thioredoxin reductase (NADPH)